MLVEVKVGRDLVPHFYEGQKVVDDTEGLQAWKARNNMQASDIAEIVGFSRRTVEGWLLGKKIPELAMFKLFHWGSNKKQLQI